MTSVTTLGYNRLRKMTDLERYPLCAATADPWLKRKSNISCQHLGYKDRV